MKIKYRIVQNKEAFIDSGKILEFDSYEAAEICIMAILSVKYSCGEWQIEKFFIKK